VGAVSEVLVDDAPPGTPPGPPWETCLGLASMNVDGETPPRTGDDAAFLSEFRLESPFVPLADDLADYAWECFTPGRPILDAAVDLTHRIHSEFQFDPDFTTVATPVSEVFRHKRGVCQDFAHLMLSCLRSIGLAARYVSGYLETDPPPGQPRLEGADASHAWVSLHVPGMGWFDFDPTNNCRPSGKHIVVAVGRDYGDVTPLKGVILGGGTHRLTVSVDVRRIADEPAWPETAI
jgi:transglutaminase-like putative cysteine protease